MSRSNYILKEDKGLRGLVHKLFSTSNQPYVPRLKVRCIFYRKDKSTFRRIVEVEHPEWHFEPEVINGMVIGERLVIDNGYITLYDKKEKYLVIGTPPLYFLFNDASPCPSWMVKMLEEDRKYVK